MLQLSYMMCGLAGHWRNLCSLPSFKAALCPQCHEVHPMPSCSFQQSRVQVGVHHTPQLRYKVGGTHCPPLALECRARCEPAAGAARAALNGWAQRPTLHSMPRVNLPSSLSSIRALLSSLTC